jgi:tetratricopeptide (TPR) repeat protein
MRAQRVRAARAARDDRLAGQRRDELLKAAGGIPDADAVIEATSYLRGLGRTDEAQKLFERAFVIQEAAAGDPDTASNLNNLAWLCARCDQRTPDAATMSRRAVAAAPENAGFWDTAAEAAFKIGDAETAIKFEQRAMSLEPNDRFMKRQLARFRAGKSDH